jgi:hypothetical protein
MPDLPDRHVLPVLPIASWVLVAASLLILISITQQQQLEDELQLARGARLAAERELEMSLRRYDRDLGGALQTISNLKGGENASHDQPDDTDTDAGAGADGGDVDPE